MRTLSLGIALALLLTGCPSGGSSSADNERLAFMQREPVLKLATRQPYAEVGFRVSDKLPLHRSHVIADLADPAEPEVARKHGAEALDTLRDSGWTVFHARCEEEAFTAGAYKVADEVSYYAELTGAAREAAVSVVLQLRAPHSRESTSDLFQDRPPALGATCLHTGEPGAAGQQIVVDGLGPEPGGAPKPAGHR